MRDCVRRFAEAMEAMLDEKEAEKKESFPNGWRDSDTCSLIDLSYVQLTRADDGNDTKRHLIHAANYCMMAYDNLVLRT